MLRILQKFRREMVGKASLRRYTLYALGEVLLVMVGILLALQVNNWNIERQERKKEYEILKDLKVEFEANLKDANRTHNGNKEIVTKMNRLQSMLQIPKAELDPLSVDTCIYALFDWFTFTPKPGASDALVNSGDLNLITNKRLRNLLVLWSGVVADLHDDENLAVDYSQNYIVPFLARNYPIVNLENLDYNISNDSTEILEKDYGLNLPPEDYNMYSMLQSKEFRSHISTKKILARHNILEGNVVIKTIDSILLTINNELTR